MFTATAETALLTVTLLARTEPDKRVPTMALAKAVHSTPPYLSKILVRLSAAGLLDGEKGRSGGYRLARSPRDITMADVITVFDEFPTPMRGRQPFCEGCPTPCGSDAVMRWACDAIHMALNATTIEQYANTCPNMQRALDIVASFGSPAHPRKPTLRSRAGPHRKRQSA